MMQEAVTALIDEQFDREVDFLQRMVQSRSTNHFTPEVSTPDVPVEQQVAGVILEQLQQLGFPASLQGVSSQRPNVMCSVPGTDPGGKSLIVTTL